MNAREALERPQGASAPDAVFVFGSNLRGAHGAGAAAYARRYKGATPGCGEGCQGMSYAVPTKDAALRTLPVEQIAEHVALFVAYTTAHPETTFEVTRVGCGLAGVAEDAMRAMFAAAPANCILPYRWQQARDASLPPRVIVAGSRTVTDTRVVYTALYTLLRELHTQWGTRLTIVSGTARGADQMGEAWATDLDLNVIQVPAQWDTYGRAAGYIRNQRMAWMASHLIAFWDGESRGTKHMLDIARADGLACRTVRAG